MAGKRRRRNARTAPDRYLVERRLPVTPAQWHPTSSRLEQRSVAGISGCGYGRLRGDSLLDRWWEISRLAVCSLGACGWAFWAWAVAF
jgi:hypothetical protein